MEDSTTKCTMIICDSCPVTATIPPKLEGITEDFLIQMMDESVENLNAAAAQSEQKIFKVPDVLRMNEQNTKSFEPQVVAIGPYHRGKRQLEPMEGHKRAATRKFICCSGHSTGEFYDKVKAVAGQARTCYAAGELGLISDEEFTLMLLFDGCFVLHFIQLFVEERMTELTVSTHLHGFIERDMFLLENQLPPIVLSALMSLKPVRLYEFLRKIAALDPKTTSEEVTSCPDQLLNLIRMEYLKPSSQRIQASGAVERHSFRSVKELQKIGIKFKRSKTKCWNDIEFNPCIVWSELTLPQIFIDDLTQSRLLNMIALEMHLGSKGKGDYGDYGITSFVWFLDCLIDREDDVRELRDAGILLNALGSDEHVAQLFNELATNLAPDYKGYDDVVGEITKHRNNKVRVSIYEFLQIHFSSPWTAIAFFAAVFLLVLTVIQTIFAIFPRL